MIKFFGRIRQRLLSGNNFSKYLLYAIGEIVLVVVGILIALQINNWNEERKQNKLEIEYLISLKGEFTANLKELERVKKLNSRNIEFASEITRHTGPQPSGITDEEFSKLFWGAMNNEVQYRPGTGIINEIIGSGNLSIIRSKELKASLASLDGLMLKIRFQENNEVASERERILEMANDMVSLRRMSDDNFGVDENMTKSKFMDSNLHLLQSMKFDNLISGFVATSGYLQRNYYGQLEEKLQAIIRTIDGQLNSK